MWNKNCRLRFQHSQKQVEYLKWKQLQLLPHALSTKQYVQHDKRRQQTYHKVQFDTKTLPCFNKYREMFYVQGVPGNIIRFLQDPLALAVWYLDDGALRTDSRAFRFHTNSYSLHDVQLLRSALKENFNIVSGIHTQQNKKQTPATHDVMGAAHIARVECSQGLLEQPPGADVQEKQYILHIGACDGQAQGFCNLVKPLVADQVPSMLYKFF